jgi:NAD(P)H-hydrate epimerase
MTELRMIPELTAEQMIEVDRLMVEEYHISLLHMMENAGRNLAALTQTMLGGRAASRRVAVLCGSGSNGGGGLVAARHLSNWGAQVTVVLANPPDLLRPVPAQQWQAISCLPVSRLTFSPEETIRLLDHEIIVDALIGYGLRGSPTGTSAALINLVNESRRPVVSLDVPSGLDVYHNRPSTPCIKASATLTLALPKTALSAPESAPYVGLVYIADIGVPPTLYTQLGLSVSPLFDSGPIIPCFTPPSSDAPVSARRLPYSPGLTRTLKQAYREARRARCKTVSTGHLLLGLLRDRTSPLSRRLARYDVTYRNVRPLVSARMTRYHQQGPLISLRRLALSHRAEEVLAQAEQEAARRGSVEVSNRHLLSALVTHPAGSATKVLAEFSVTPDDITGLCMNDV